MMKKILCFILCAVILLSFCACGEDDPVEVTFDADLTLDVLEVLLLEKGDALLVTDIPENYTYLFHSVGVVPQIIYPISETVSFSVIPISDGKNMLTLSVKTEDGTTLDYVGTEDILSYIEEQKAE